MTAVGPIEFSHDRQTITIFGVHYAIELFRHLGVGSIGSRFEIVAREDGAVTLTQLRTEQWLSDPKRAEVIDVLGKVACVPTTGFAMVDEEAIDEARELLDRLQRHAQPPSGAA